MKFSGANEGDWVFLSHVLSEESPAYGNRPGLQILESNSMARGGSSNTMVYRLPNHSGTHVDCPRHFSDDGQTLDEFSAAEWAFERIFLLDIPKRADEIISAKDVEERVSELSRGERPDPEVLLIRTGFEAFRGQTDYWERNPGLSPDLGAYLRARLPSVHLIGLDTISVTGFQNRELGRMAHKELLDPNKPGAPVRVVEDMSLKNLKAGPKKMIVAPLRVKETDGGPCTILALI